MKEVQTQFGIMPIGSPLSLQCSLIPANFDVYSTVLDPTSQFCNEFRTYPSFPFQATEDSISENVKSIRDVKKVTVLRKLNQHVVNIIEIEKSTRDQSSNPEWFMFRKNRFTASICNKLGQNTPKTPKGLKTLALVTCILYIYSTNSTEFIQYLYDRLLKIGKNGTNCYDLI